MPCPKANMFIQLLSVLLTVPAIVGVRTFVRLLFLMQRLPKGTPDRWEFIYLCLNAKDTFFSTCMSMDYFKSFAPALEILLMADGTRTATHELQEKEFEDLCRLFGNSYSELLIPSQTHCEHCHNLLGTAYEGIEVIVYGTSKGTVKGMHFKKRCTNRKQRSPRAQKARPSVISDSGLL